MKKKNFFLFTAGDGLGVPPADDAGAGGDGEGKRLSGGGHPKRKR